MRTAIALLATSAAAWGQASAEDLAAGGRLFRTQCAHCHGLRGDGGKGANLAVPRLRHAADDEALLRVIERGIPGTLMPGTDLNARQARQLAAYVRSLGRVAPQTLSGDAARGRRVYEGKGGCAQCHTVAGRGGGLGPDLSDAGARSSAAYLRESLLEPEKDVPNGFLQVRLVTEDGQRHTGVRLNEDTFSIQILDLAGEPRAFWKRELKELQKDFGKSPMPSYRSILTAEEVEDVVAYLVSPQ